MTIESRELEIFFSNEEWLIKPSTIAIGKAYKAGSFSYDRAIKHLEARCRDAAKAYTKEFCSPETNWQQLFSVADRKVCARDLLQSMLQEFELGNYWG